jgi:hypothetical protein
LHGVGDVCVVEQDAGGFAAEFERDVLEVRFCCGGHYGASTGGAAGESDFGDLHVGREQGAGGGGAGEDVDYAGGEAGLFLGFEFKIGLLICKEVVDRLTSLIKSP